MQPRLISAWLAFCVCTLCCPNRAPGTPFAINTNLQIRLVLNTINSVANSVRIAKDPRTGQLYYLKLNGDIFQVSLASGSGSTSQRVYSAANHGLASNVEGMTIGADGTIYIVGNTFTNQGNSNWVRIMKGVPGANGVRSWSLLAQTQPYPLSRTAFDHLCSGLVISPDGHFLFLNSGSRTDHGEVQSTGGLYPNLRDTGLTAKILRLPLDASNLFLTNDLSALRQGGYVFAEGTRNAFSLAFAPNGDLFAVDNGPDRDMSDELNWIRQGLQYGFPWRLGGADNPQQFPDYNPTNDLLLDKRFIAVSSGYYHNDPTFPPPPPGGFAEPVINLGPDACSYRDPTNGLVHIASQLGQTLSTLTAHRSPLGLVFDTAGAMAPPFQGHGFMLSWTPGDPTGDTLAGPFMDPSQDMVDLGLTKLGDTNYQARITRIVGGFANPSDAAILGNKIYVIEYGGNEGIWEITFPPAPPPITLSQPAWQGAGGFSFSISGTAIQQYEIDASTDLLNWSFLASVPATNSPFQFLDSGAGNYPIRFYRVKLP
ncbi:MAG TPA: PQQ-dependent sugar dehydrogenase [Verrucomicrobiae bacterium]|nr:PQQ-dependent sugar dehydrogenase [Verrucomicrobiae bacterium]